MIGYNEFYLDNGLQVIVHEDPRSPIVCLNLLYKVGSRNEDSEKTGFAHLFEHLMFGGSRHIPQFDEPLQAVGGDSNAFTNTDVTNYYITVPKNNVETAFWLESDRMLSLSFDPEVLEVQRKVVIEEFKQRYLNQPYGDVWLKLRPLAYQVHPYQWATIGKHIDHIEAATMDDVRSFFGQHYGPDNAVLVLAGGISEAEAIQLTEKWFGPVPAIGKSNGTLPKEPVQTAARYLKLEDELPANAIYKAYHMGPRLDGSYHATDLLSDLLGRSSASYLHQELVKNHSLFSSISGYVMGSVDPGLLVISGRLLEETSFDAAEEAIDQVLDKVRQGNIDPIDLERVKNQAESATAFSEVELLNRAMALAFAAFLGDVNLANEEINMIRNVTADKMVQQAKTILRAENCSTIHYQKSS
ncbi:MAG: pitrilysin family protein [Bacteroidota bacterium]